MRPSIESARMASPAYSMTEPVPPAVPISPMMASVMSLAVTPGERAVHLDEHVLGLLLDQRLGGEHMLDLRSADAVRQRPEGAMGRGVAVAADHGHARQGRTLFRSDDMNNAVTDVVHLEFSDAVLVAIVVEGLHLQTRNRVGNGSDTALALRGRRYVVVRGRDVGINAPRLAPGQTQAFKGLRRGHFVNDVTVDVDQRRPIVALFDQVRIPKFVVKRFANHHTFLITFLYAKPSSRVDSNR
jgi:hypothetical protein